MTAQELIAEAQAAFAHFPHPLHSVNPDCCAACADHDAALREVTRETLTIDHLGLITWGPLPHLTPEAFGYFMPRLVEFAVTGGVDRDGDPFMARFINQTGMRGQDVTFSGFDAHQRKVVRMTLVHLQAVHREGIRAQGWEGELHAAMELWRDPCPPSGTSDHRNGDGIGGRPILKGGMSSSRQPVEPLRPGRQG